jgi:transcriptional regulatory protein LevR/transcriptional regulator with AAA-type ATPase domain
MNCTNFANLYFAVVAKRSDRMKRQFKVLEVLERLCAEGITIESLKQPLPVGYIAEEIAAASGLSRSNTSGDLNVLHRSGLVIKVTGRPTYYIARSWVEQTISPLVSSIPLTIKHHEELLALLSLKSTDVVNRQINKTDNMPITEKNKVFDQLIGAQGSLKVAVEQAKAAVLYPPKGLDTLLVGPTGVGKTLFAEYMYYFAKSAGKIKGEGLFVVFNCADYANNPQLLMSQLFGHVRGAFTGADKDKMGLVEKADGGILFLDEVHRLPPEGQEMLFYLLDRREFRRMGESDQQRKVTIRIIAATTEEPDSALLKTFLRRIPLVIHLPELSERPLSERFALIQFLLSKEAEHLKADIVVTQETLWALLLYRCYGNIGQLRNDLQLVCAKSLLHSSGSPVQIGYEMLPPKVKQSLMHDAVSRMEASRILSHLGGDLVVFASQAPEMAPSQTLMPVDIYKTIDERMKFLRKQGITQSEVIQCIEMDIDAFFSQVSPKNKILKPEYLKNLLTPDFVKEYDLAFHQAEERLGRTLSNRLYYGLAIHIAAALERVKKGLPINNPNYRKIKQKYAEEFVVAQELADAVNIQSARALPQEEVSFIAYMLASFDNKQEKEMSRVNVIVLTHGRSTASSMVDFCHQLLGVNHARAIDMSLETSVVNIIEQAVAAAQEIDEGKGLLLLVDMGSLLSIGKEIQRRTDIVVKSMDMVTTLMVLHAIHKAVLPQNGLEEVYQAVWDVRNPFQSSLEKPNRFPVAGNKDQAIITTCFSGQGAALKIKELVEDLLNQWQLDYVRVIPLEAGNEEQLKKRLNTLVQSYDIVGSVGSIDPAIPGKFHISLEKFLQGGAGVGLRKILSGDLGASDIADRYSDQGLNWEVMRTVLISTLDEFLTFVNPRKVLTTLLTCTKQFEEQLEFSFSHSGLLRIMIHASCMIERLLTDAQINYSAKDSCIKEHKEEYAVIRQNIVSLEQQFSVTIPDDEICYLIDIIDIEKQRPVLLSKPLEN